MVAALFPSGTEEKLIKSIKNFAVTFQKMTKYIRHTFSLGMYFNWLSCNSVVSPTPKCQNTFNSMVVEANMKI